MNGFLEKAGRTSELLSKQKRERERARAAVAGEQFSKRAAVSREQFSILKPSWSSRPIASKDSA